MKESNSSYTGAWREKDVSDLLDIFREASVEAELERIYQAVFEENECYDVVVTLVCKWNFHLILQVWQFTTSVVEM